MKKEAPAIRYDLTAKKGRPSSRVESSAAQERRVERVIRGDRRAVKGPPLLLSPRD